MIVIAVDLFWILLGVFFQSLPDIVVRSLWDLKPDQTPFVRIWLPTFFHFESITRAAFGDSASRPVTVSSTEGTIWHVCRTWQFLCNTGTVEPGNTSLGDSAKLQGCLWLCIWSWWHVSAFQTQTKTGTVQQQEKESESVRALQHMTEKQADCCNLGFLCVLHAVHRWPPWCSHDVEVQSAISVSWIFQCAFMVGGCVEWWMMCLQNCLACIASQLASLPWLWCQLKGNDLPHDLFLAQISLHISFQISVRNWNWCGSKGALVTKAVSWLQRSNEQKMFSSTDFHSDGSHCECSWATLSFWAGKLSELSTAPRTSIWKHTVITNHQKIAFECHVTKAKLICHDGKKSGVSETKWLCGREIAGLLMCFASENGLHKITTSMLLCTTSPNNVEASNCAIDKWNWTIQWALEKSACNSDAELFLSFVCHNWRVWWVCQTDHTTICQNKACVFEGRQKWPMNAECLHVNVNVGHHPPFNICSGMLLHRWLPETYQCLFSSVHSVTARVLKRQGGSTQ